MIVEQNNINNQGEALEHSLHGGKLLSQGSYGCVYKPALKCKGASERISGFVSKIMLKKEAKDEIEEQKVIDALDPNYHYHLKIGKECVPENPDSANDNNLVGCVLHGEDLHQIQKTTKLQDEYLIVHIEDGGMGLGSYFKKTVKSYLKKTHKMSELKHCEMMLYDFTRLIYGLNEFSKKNMGHFDLKTDNIVYKEETNRFNFIDFGFSGTYEEFMKKHENWGRTYWAFPIERMFAHYDDLTVKNSFYNHVLKLANTNLGLNDMNNDKNPDFTYLKFLFRRFMIGYRETFNEKYVRRLHTYNSYGIDSSLLPSDKFVYDYIEAARDMIKKNKSDKEIMEHFSHEIIKNLNTFSMSLVMIEMIYYIMNYQNTDKFKIVSDYGNKDTTLIDEYKKKLDKISPQLAKFYDLMLKMNVPSFNKRISTQEAYDYYLKEVYTPLKNKYNLEDLKFIQSRREQEKKMYLPLSSSSVESLDISNRELISDLQTERTQKPRETKKVKTKTKNLTRKAIKKICPEGKILNPLTNRCVNKKGATYKNLLKKRLISRSKTSSPKTMKKGRKNCPDGKVLNPLTNRCINKNGATYNKIKKHIAK
jgi:serine/threonine protein kinase